MDTFEDRVATDIATSERNRPPVYGSPRRSVPPSGEGGEDPQLAGRVLPVEAVARLTVEAIIANRLYVLPHQESRSSIRRRLERIDRTFDEQSPA